MTADAVARTTQGSFAFDDTRYEFFSKRHFRLLDHFKFPRRTAGTALVSGVVGQNVAIGEESMQVLTIFCVVFRRRLY